jgi:UDP-N-acetylmuramoyl-tripeptide--D-alanyl-D-alanine ligase
MLSGLPGRRVAILGEMLELGPYHDEGHRQVGEAAARTVDLLCVVGGAGPAAPLVEAALQSGLSAEAVVVADDAEGARRLMEPLLQPGDVVLIKASRGVGLDRLVDALRADLAAREDSSPAAQDGGFPAARQAGSLAGRQASSSSGAGGGGEGTAG